MRSRSGLEVPPPLSATVEASSESPERLLRRLESEGVDHVYGDGGQVIGSFFVRGLIEEITITQIRMVLGAGIPLFAQVASELQLEHISNHA